MLENTWHVWWLAWGLLLLLIEQRDLTMGSDPNVRRRWGRQLGGFPLPIHRLRKVLESNKGTSSLKERGDEIWQ